ncbi:dihydrolipoyl dehydrogenase [Parabacteroides sp. FAFU027]|uniref:dihydrolipoyl dehydrogenase n=1 Tax=Parabacteroides sp. FAFU027 TaxID=2922715 RepID=UPI001FAECDC5|nr:dihydrolipoyl dehydrogenase [Parabacteroides sp. FAFU027]
MAFDVAIIGGGPAGYTVAERLAKGGLKIVLFEKRALGGVCLNEGCIPTKTMLYSAKILDTIRNSAKYGITSPEPSFDLPKILQRKTKVVKKLTAGIRAKLTAHNVTMINGEAKVLSAANDQISIKCGEETYSVSKLILCTGSETVIPTIPGLTETVYWTSREALESKEVPESLTIVGGGVIGLEFASLYNSLGSRVTVVEMLDEILPGMDCEVSALLREEYTRKGVKFLLGTKVTSINQSEITLEKQGEQTVMPSEKVLISVGRRPVLTGYGLENLTLERFRNGIAVNEVMQTSQSNIYACGDITGFSLLAHTAVREAEVAANHILGISDKMNYPSVPAVVYTNPEIAGVGETEESLKEKNITYSVKKQPMTFSGRFVTENELFNGLCKVIIGENEKILGVHIFGNPASEIIALAGMAIEHGLTLSQWQRTVFPHPTVGEIFKEV